MISESGLRALVQADLPPAALRRHPWRLLLRLPLVVRSRRVQEAVLHVTGLIYGASPHLWMVRHDQAHHGHTNIPDEDPTPSGPGRRSGTTG